MKIRSDLFGAIASSLLLGSAAALGASPAPAPSLAMKPAPAGAAAPHLQFEATTVDLGDVVRGQDASAVFTYRNTGDAELKILAAKPG